MTDMERSPQGTTRQARPEGQGPSKAPSPMAPEGFDGSAAPQGSFDVISAADAQEAASDEDMAERAVRVAQERKRAKRRKRLIKIAVAAGLAVVVVGGCAYSGFVASQEASKGVVLTDVVSRGDYSSTVGASGKAAPLSSAVVTPEVEGIIQDIRVSEGSTVSEGDVLFTLRNDELDKAVRNANQQVKSAQTALDSAYNAYNQAVDRWNSATSEEEQKAMQDPDSLLGPINEAKVTLETARDNYNDAVAKADKRTVVAPCSGSVVAMNAVSGAAWGSAAGAGGQAGSSPLVQIADISQMTVTAQVNEVDISKLAVGQEASVTFSALPGISVKATVTRIATVASGESDQGGAYGAGGVVTYAVELLIPNPDPSLKPGMTANATITTESIKDALLVPADAVTTDESGASHVRVATTKEGKLDEGSFETKAVKVLAKNSTVAAIEGLSEGDVVFMGMSYPGGGDGDASAGMVL